MPFHQPVMLAEVVDWMNLKDDGLYCDCTVGGAGHLRTMLMRAPRARFIGVDWDPEAVDYAQGEIKPYSDRCLIFQENFVNLGLILDRQGVSRCDGIFLDLGVSYHQLTTPERGFSFEREGRLLMQMSPESMALVQRLRNSSREEISGVLKTYGDVFNHRRLGRAIYENRKALETTLDLQRLLAKTVPRRFLKKNLRRVFQALRIWTNNELENLSRVLAVALERLSLGGRIVVISYHSGEDRIVKNFFREKGKIGQLKILTKQVLKPSRVETEVNPRARSARMRVAERCAVC
jgi:16S rRNA (cytosine1402-N4)-methyltransferase